MMKKINVHFCPVTENRHIFNMYAADDAFTLQSEALKPFITSRVALGIVALKIPEMEVNIKNAFARDGLFTFIRDPIKLLEMQVECALNLRDTGVFMPAKAKDSDQDEELVLADMSASESDSDSDSD